MRRVTILKYAKKILFTPNVNFLCIAIRQSIQDNLELQYAKVNEIIPELLPKFNYKYALEAGFANHENDFVWFSNNKDRAGFLDHLIDVYKDDKIDIKKKYKKLIENNKIYETD